MFQVVPSKIAIKDDEELKTTIAKMYELIDTINLRTILLDLTLNYLIRTNNLSDDEFFLLKRGREIKVYT